MENSLQKYLGIEDISPYENVLISESGFSSRVRNCLRRNGYVNLAEILKSSGSGILALRSMGQGSFDNLLSTLEKMFSVTRKNSYAKNLSSDDEKFVKSSTLVTIKNLFNNLPDELKHKRVKFFLNYLNLAEKKFFAELPAELSFEELPEYLNSNLNGVSIDELEIFAEKIPVDVNGIAKKILADVLKNDRDFYIVSKRIEGVTLEEIGKNLGLTRERVRQIELSVTSRFINHRNELVEIFYFIHAMNDCKSLMILDDVKVFIDSVDAEIIWLLVSRHNFKNVLFNFDKDLNALVFDGAVDFDEKNFLDNLPYIIEENVFEETVRNLARENNCPVELIKIKIAKIYKRTGKVLHRGKLTLTFQCAYVLKTRFPDGYKIGNEDFYLRFIRHIQEIFNEKTVLTPLNIYSKIGIVGFLCDRGKYIHPDFVHVPPEIIERVKDFIDASDRTAIFYKEIFKALKNIFVGTQVTNHYFLQGLIKFKNLPYVLRKDYLTKSDEVNMTKEFDNFIAERGEVSTSEIKENFISFRDFNIVFLADRCPKVISVGNGKFIHASRLNLQESDFEPIKKFLRQICSTPVNLRNLEDLFFDKFTDFMTRNDIQNYHKLFGILKYMFKDEFNFSRPYISVTDIKDFSHRKILLSNLANVDKLTIGELEYICEKTGIHYLARTYLIEIISPDFIRVDANCLVRPAAIGVTDEFVYEVVENVQAAVERNGGWLVAKTFEDYELLPQLETAWNDFFLESVVSLADDAPIKIKLHSTSSTFSQAIFLSEEFADDNYQSLVTKILISENNRAPFGSDNEILNWLQSKGLCNKKLPKFLEDGKAFQLLSE